MQIDPKFQPLIDLLVADVRERDKWVEEAKRTGERDEEWQAIGQRASYKTALGYALYTAEGKDVPGVDPREQREIARTRAISYLATHPGPK
ncbi:hypothetical protein [Microbispora sp. NPDC049125]|uniref:hypothetical protein n=1 Tax=Microbispora sp. NPDC049125 TaxID=3154929 RepID=UPI003467D8EF